MRFVCDSCRAQYMISDEKVGPNGVKVRCKKCGFVILVRKADAAAASVSAPPPPPIDDSPSDRTVVVETHAEISNEPTSPAPPIAAGGRAAPTAVLKGVEDDEIGAVFDQALNGAPKMGPEETTSTSTSPLAGSPDGFGGDGDDEDDRLRTRVLDQSMMQKLAAQSATPGGEAAANFNGHAKKNGNGAGSAAASAAPAQDWFVAIDDKQTGPLTVEKLKDLWNRGEIGPDSLCWRAGFADWLPLSEVSELSPVLAPKPSKPVIVSSPTITASPVVTVPVESAFSAGGVSRAVRSEVPVPVAASASAEETGTWKPSAASALASLVQEEIAALNKPAGGQVAALDAAVAARSILEMPPDQTPSAFLGNGAAPAAPVERPSNPMLVQETPSAAYGHRPPPAPVPAARNKGLYIGAAAGGVVVIGLLVAILWMLADRGPSERGAESSPRTERPAASAPATEKKATAPVVPPPSSSKEAVPMPPPPAGTTQKAAEAKTDATPGSPGTATAEAIPPPPPTAVPDPPPAALVPRAERPSRSSSSESGSSKKSRAAVVDDDDEVGTFTAGKSKSSAPPPPETSGTDDEFEREFGNSKSKELSSAKSPEKKKSASIYVPPAPGSVDIPDRLGQSDVMQVVLSNKPNIVKCVNEQKKKDPGMSGKLVMKWVIQTSGKTSNVSVVSEEFKNTYLATCIGGLIKTWQFPKHKNQGDPINFPFTF